MTITAPPRVTTAALLSSCLGVLLAGCQTIENEFAALTAETPELTLSEDDVCVQQRRNLIATNDFFARNRDGFGQAGTDLLTVIGLDMIGLGGTSLSTDAQQRLATQFDEAITSLVSNLREDTAQIQDSQIAFEALVECRKAEADLIRSSYNRGQIRFETAQMEMAEVRDRFTEELAYARSINEQFAERADEFNVTRRQARQSAVTRGASEDALDSADMEADEALASNQRARAASEQQVSAAEELQNDPEQGFVLS